MAMFDQIAAEPPCVCSDTSSMPEISAIMRSVVHTISSTPCASAGFCSGCMAVSAGVPTSWSLTFGAYFMVQVPWPMSTLKSAPRFSCESRR